MTERWRARTPPEEAYGEGAGGSRGLVLPLGESLSGGVFETGERSVEVSVEADGDPILRVTGNGSGIGPNTRRSGLANMAERAQLLGGTLHTGPADESAGTGTILEWRVPPR